jgi:hypothetical protein
MKLYAFFHLNLAFSSIEEEKRIDVIRQSYRPLLDLIKKHRLAWGIELSAYTLEEIQRLDPQWVADFKQLLHENVCELVGSGYSQMIAPLVPAEVTRQNLAIGCETYEKLLGVRPRIALVNEQAWSAGLVDLYLDAGFEAVIMERANAFRHHHEWSEEWMKYPQRAQGTNGQSIPLLWNHAIAFQKFQRVIHNEITREEYLQYLQGHYQSGTVFTLYGNDAEVFNYRPGRFTTESTMQKDEWFRMEELIISLQKDEHYKLCSLQEALQSDHPLAHQELELGSPQEPIPVKKQLKYNISRWAISGRNDLGINTACHRIARHLIEQGGTKAEWKELCYLWSSDFRTHITPKRWERYEHRLQQSLSKYRLEAPRGLNDTMSKVIPAQMPAYPLQEAIEEQGFRISQEGRFLRIEHQSMTLILNLHKGLAIELWESWENKEKGKRNKNSKPLIGTIPHGHYQDIELGADFFSGHSVLEQPGHRLQSDLQQSSPGFAFKDGNCIIVEELQIGEHKVQKNIECRIVQEQAELHFSYQFATTGGILGSLRTGFVTLMPQAFAEDSLHYSTHNGGKHWEHYYFNQHPVRQGESINTMISAQSGLGATQGLIRLGDSKKQVEIFFDPTQCAAFPLIKYTHSRGQYFARLCFSLSEMDETRKPEGGEAFYNFTWGLRVHRD